MRSKASTVDQYLAELPADRREAIEALRKTILDHLPEGYEEGMQYGMIGYYVPHAIHPEGYHCDPKQPVPFASLASQKNHMALYLMCVYSDEAHAAWFVNAWNKTGRKLDMGKSCIRFNKLEDIPLEVVGQAIKRVPVKKLLAQYEAARASTPRGAKKTTTKKTTTKKKTKKTSR
jgi:uncharacterized protein YdhG (YjbR/CyaY superfamily)